LKAGIYLVADGKIVMTIRRAETAVVAESASAKSNSAIAVWACESSMDTHLLQPGVKSLLVVIGQGVKSSGVAPGIDHQLKFWTKILF
jgi:hypothetical protein